MKKSNFFWVGYSDLMTSLFFIMLVLYVITFAILRVKQSQIEADARQLNEIKNIQTALENLDTNYFAFDSVNKRYRLKIDVSFNSGSSNILDLSQEKREEVYRAGVELYEQVKEITTTNPNVDYLLVIEGNTQRSDNNWVRFPNVGYRLSYRRALSLFNYWKGRGLDFRKIGPQCELIIAGSGYFGHSRDTVNEINNRKFSIQITSKVGKLIDRRNER